MSEIKKGIYEHFKGRRYKVLGVGRHSESLEDLVVYQALSDEEEIWVRPKSMFLEEVMDVEGKMVPRFRYVDN